MPFMPHPRPSAWALIGVLLATMLFSAEAAPVAFANQPRPTCTGWSDDLHPPDVIRVLRSKGPDKGQVQVANFWDYVAVVMRAEYSTGADKPPLWMRIGAITVKQYGWFFAMSWRGGHATWTDPDTGSSVTQCYDVKDNTADQIYKPQETNPDGTIFPGNIPTPAIYRAMRETWHMTLRKWVVNKNKSRLFLTGYRSGRQVPCGADSTGFKIYQQSLRDCYVKHLTTYETLRRYFEPTQIVNTREHDMLSDSGSWRGDLGVLSDGGNGTTQWRLYAGGSDAFAPAANGSLNVGFGSIVGYGAGNVDGADANGAADPKLFADLVMVTTDEQVLVARATGTGLSSSLISTSFTGAADRMVLGDFDGDLLADVGLIRSSGGTSTLQVMLAKGDGTFGAPQDWWTGPDLGSALFVAAGDINGDGKDDLIARDSTGTFEAALSPASCADFSVWGPCPSASIGAPTLSAFIATPPNNVGAGAKLTVGDYDRDGRADILAVATDGTSIFGMRGKSDGTFADPQTLWSGSGATGQPIALNVNPDGISDMAFVRTGAVGWFRTNERSTSPASMTQMTSLPDSNLTGSGRPF